MNVALFWTPLTISDLFDFAIIGISAIPILIAVKRKHANIARVEFLNSINADQRIELAHSLWNSSYAEAEAQWRKEVGEPEPGYDEWFRAGVEEALADTSGAIPHEDMMREIGDIFRSARERKKLKAST